MMKFQGSVRGMKEDNVDVNDGAFGEAAYCHHRHHLDEHSTDFRSCHHKICLAAREEAERAGEDDYKRKVIELSELVSRIWEATGAESDGQVSIVKSKYEEAESQLTALRQALDDAVATLRRLRTHCYECRRAREDDWQTPSPPHNLA